MYVLQQFLVDQLIIVLNGLSRASTLFLLGTGLSLVYGMLNFMNLAHAAFLPLGAYLSASLIRRTTGVVGDSLGFVGLFVVFLVVLLLVVPAIASMVGLAMERALFEPLYDLEDDYHLLATFGIILMMEDSMKFVWGGQPVSATAPADLLGTFPIPGGIYPWWSILTILITAAIAGTLYYFFEATRLGRITLAMAEDKEIVSVTGVDTRSIHLKIFVISVGLAALGGALYLPGASITTGLSLEFVILAFAVLVIGGLGSLKGAIVASLIIGLVQAYGIYYIPQLALAAVFLLMTAVILVKPTGLFGEIDA
jgi:branched-chain amino acid transport system permease protein